MNKCRIGDVVLMDKKTPWPEPDREGIYIGYEGDGYHGIKAPSSGEIWPVREQWFTPKGEE